MAEVEKYAKDLIEVSRLAKEFSSSVSNACGGSFEWGIEEMGKSFLSLFDRFCPYDVGDQVQLSMNIPIKKSSGWYRARHFLIRGAIATISARGYRNDRFTFDLVFDDESRIDDKGQKHMIERKHTYSINESYLLPCNKRDA